jgi:hypothetical protein
MRKIILVQSIILLMNVYLIFGVLSKFTIKLGFLDFLIIHNEKLSFYVLFLMSIVSFVVVIIFMVVMFFRNRKRLAKKLSKNLKVFILINFVVSTTIFILFSYILVNYLSNFS